MKTRPKTWKYCARCGQEACSCTSAEIATVWNADRSARCSGAECGARFPHLLREMRGFCPFCGRRHGFVTDFKHGDWIADRDLPQVQGMVIDRYYHADKIPIYRIWHAESGEETMILDSTAVLVRTLEDAFKAIADALPEIMDTIHQGLDEMIRGLEQQTESEDVGIGTD